MKLIVRISPLKMIELLNDENRYPINLGIVARMEKLQGDGTIVRLK